MTTLYTSHVEFGTLRVFMRMYMMVTSVPTKDGLSHYQNSTSLSAFGSILKKKKLGTVSIDVRVVLLVEYDKTMYIPYRVGNS